MSRHLEEGEEAAGVVLKSGGHSLTIWCQDSTYTGQCSDFANYFPGDWVSYHFKKHDDISDELVVNNLAARLATVKEKAGGFTAKARIAIQPYWFNEEQLIWSPEFNVVKHGKFAGCDLDILAPDRLYEARIQFDGHFKLLEIGDSCKGQAAMDILFAPWRVGELEQMQSTVSAMAIERDNLDWRLSMLTCRHLICV